MEKPIDFQKSRGAALRMGLASVLLFIEHRRNILSIEQDKLVGQYKATGSRKEQKSPAARLKSPRPTNRVKKFTSADILIF